MARKEVISSGISGTDIHGRTVVFVAGPPPNVGAWSTESPDNLVDQAIALEEGSGQLRGDASVAMLLRSEELFKRAVELDAIRNGVIFDRRANGSMGKTQIANFQL